MEQIKTVIDSIEECEQRMNDINLDENEQVFNRVGLINSGEGFGELALLSSNKGKRAARIICTQNC